ncbi:hypothetical protein BD414DRAFT_492966 [Trametes punicea]|nr:hypothetical protein BD414DRAFT_492966 [Trametes punicea]
MPWRVGRDIRHLYQATQSLLERSRIPLHPLCLIAKPIHSTWASWRPAVALKLNHSHAAVADGVVKGLEIADPDDVDLESVVLRWKRPSSDAHSSAPQAKPPPNMLSIIETIFSRPLARLPSLEDLRENPAAAELVTYLRLPHRAPVLVRHLLDVREYWRALWALRIAKEIGYNFSPKFYGEAIQKLAEMKKWSLVLTLTHTAREHLGYTTTGLLNWRLQAYMESQRFLSLQEALDLFTQEDVRPSRLTYHLLIAMNLRNHDLTAALASIRAMESAGFGMSPRTWAVVLLNYRSLGLPPSAKARAFSALQTADGPTATAIINSLVQLLLDAHDMRGVVEILSMASQHRGDPPADLGAGTTGEEGVASAAAEQKGPASDSSTGLTRRILIDISTYNTLLTYLSRQGDLVSALRTLEEMRNARILPNADTAVALVRLYLAANHPNDALHIVSDALGDFPEAAALLPRLGFTESVPPQHPTYPGVASPTISLFNALIWGVLRFYGLSGLKAAFRIMRVAQVDVNQTTVGVLMSYLHRHERPRPREMIRAVRALMSAGIAPTTRNLHVLMAALVREERLVAHPRGWAVDSDSVGNTDSPTKERPSDPSNCFQPTAGITIPRRLRYRSLMRPIIQSLMDRGVRSDPVAFALRIKQDAVVKGDLNMALTTFRTMLETGIRPNEYHYGALMEGFAAAGDMKAAADVMREAVNAGANINVNAHTILIAGHARLGQATEAAEAFRRMVAEGIRPDVPAIDALTSAFFRAKAYGMARRVLLQLWPQVGPLPEELVEAPLRQLAVAFRAMHRVKSKAPPRLSSREQRMLRWKIRDILLRWKSSLGYSRNKGGVGHHRNRLVPSPRIPGNNRPEGR